jgi:hypothetical protein
MLNVVVAHFAHCTGGPRYSRTFYLRIRLFTSTKRVQNNNFPVKIGLFICEFKIRGPNWRSLSTANNEGNLYFQSNYPPKLFYFTEACDTFFEADSTED